MRAFEGQRSDNQPIKRSRAEKQAQLATLEARLASMKSHESPAFRESLQRKISELRAELGSGGGR